MRTAPSRTRVVLLAVGAATAGAVAGFLALAPPATPPETGPGGEAPAHEAPRGSTASAEDGRATPAPRAAASTRPDAPAGTPTASSAPSPEPSREAAEQNAAVAEAPEEADGPFDTAHPPADPCQALAQDDERLTLTQGFIDKLPAKNRDKVGAKVLYDLRDRTEKARARHQAQADAAGVDCGADE